MLIEALHLQKWTEEFAKRSTECVLFCSTETILKSGWNAKIEIFEVAF